MDAVREKKTHYTYKDYMNWPDDVRVELIDGQVYDMSPAPSPVHQGICLEIAGQMRSFLKGKPCRAFVSPIDVRLSAGEKDDTVVQPDIIVVCDKSKIGDKSINGVPDMVVEILSPSTSRHDRLTKLNKYREAGVREYWIVSPEDKAVTDYVLKNGEYVVRAYGEKDLAPVAILEGFEVNLKEVFTEE